MYLIKKHGIVSILVSAVAMAALVVSPLANAAYTASKGGGRFFIRLGAECANAMLKLMDKKYHYLMSHLTADVTYKVSTRPNRENPRMARERRTFDVMLKMYCRDRHQSVKGLCASCAALQAYARERLAECPFQEDKSSCLKCPVHCYAPEMRARVREVMRYAGPRMIWHHPWLALMHLIEKR